MKKIFLSIGFVTVLSALTLTSCMTMVTSSSSSAPPTAKSTTQIFTQTTMDIADLSLPELPQKTAIKEPHIILGRFYCEFPAEEGLGYSQIYNAVAEQYPDMLDITGVTIDTRTVTRRTTTPRTPEPGSTYTPSPAVSETSAMFYIVTGLAIKYTNAK